MNIFAEVLAEVLAEHGKELGSLYSMSADYERINQNKVGLLKKSLNPESDQSAVLSVWEMDVMRAYFRTTPRVPSQPPQPITEAQDRRLKAAIFAEGIRRMVWERFKSDAEHTGITSIQAARTTAYHIGRLVYDLLLTVKDPDGVRKVNSLMESIRGVPSLESGSARKEEEKTPSSLLADDSLEPLLATGVETLMQGSVWLEAAREATDREQQQILASYASALLRRAKKQVNDAPPSEQQEAWGEEVERALDDTLDLM